MEQSNPKGRSSGRRGIVERFVSSWGTTTTTSLVATSAGLHLHSATSYAVSGKTELPAMASSDPMRWWSFD